MNPYYEKITALRIECGIKNDAELAKLAGVRQGLLSDLKKNDSQELSPKNLRIFSSFFNAIYSI